MQETKNTLAERMYKELDIACNGEFDFWENHDEFVEAFKKVLYDYSLVPTTSIIE